MKILVQRHGAFGDVVAVSPVVRKFRHLYGGGATIHVETDYPGVFDGSLDVDRAATGFGDDVRTYDLVVRLDGSYERGLRRVHPIDAYMETAFGSVGTWDERAITAPRDLRPVAVHDFVKGHDRVVAVHAATTWSNRTVPLDFWADVVGRLHAAGLATVTVGTPRDLAPPTCLDTRHLGLTVGQQASVIDACSVYVGVDTGLAQLAAATSTPMVVLFTQASRDMSPMYRRGGPDWRTRPVWAGVDCVGCCTRFSEPVIYVPCLHDGTPRHDECVRSFDAGEVARAVLESELREG